MAKSKASEELNRRADEVWEQIRTSPIAGIYLLEAFRLAEDVEAGLYSALKKVRRPPAGAGYLTVDHDIHRHIAVALNSAARLRALCIDRGRGSRQSALEHKVELRRAAWLRDLLSGVDLEPIRDAQVRHTLEHFDEYVDQTAIDAVTGVLQMPALLPVDLVLSERHLLSQFDVGGATPVIYPVRVYVSDEDRYINCGHEVDVAALRKTSCEVRDRLAPLLGQQAEERSSSIVVLTAQTFPGPDLRTTPPKYRPIAQSGSRKSAKRY